MFQSLPLPCDLVMSINIDIMYKILYHRYLCMSTLNFHFGDNWYILIALMSNTEYKRGVHEAYCQAQYLPSNQQVRG